MRRSLVLLLALIALTASPSLAQTSGGSRSGAASSTGGTGTATGTATAATGTGNSGGGTAGTAGGGTGNQAATRVTRTRSLLICPEGSLGGDIDAAIHGSIACVP